MEKVGHHSMPKEGIWALHLHSVIGWLHFLHRMAILTAIFQMQQSAGSHSVFSSSNSVKEPLGISGTSFFGEASWSFHHPANSSKAVNDTPRTDHKLVIWLYPFSVQHWTIGDVSVSQLWVLGCTILYDDMAKIHCDVKECWTIEIHLDYDNTLHEECHSKMQCLTGKSHQTP